MTPFENLEDMMALVFRIPLPIFLEYGRRTERWNAFENPMMRYDTSLVVFLVGCVDISNAVAG